MQHYMEHKSEHFILTECSVFMNGMYDRFPCIYFYCIK